MLLGMMALGDTVGAPFEFWLVSFFRKVFVLARTAGAEIQTSYFHVLLLMDTVHYWTVE